ncbi:MAG: SDR family oxidoreductase [Rhodobacteraceae bacterium]|nr:SDR family oxidoreductase [Paracoccaceae bacterium]
MKNTAMIVGASGLSGSNLARHLQEVGDWKVYGLSRSGAAVSGVDEMVKLDLTNREAAMTKLGRLRDVSHVYFCTWSRQETEAENCIVNRAMVKNALDGLSCSRLRHVALVTGTKHYLGPFDAYAQGRPYTPFQEDQPRLPGQNFYYEQEDEVFEAAKTRGFTWSVHRPHTMIGYTLGNAMNMAVTLAVYATICRATGRPFLFPGSAAQYEAVTDITDARLLAEHLHWAGTCSRAANTAFNIVNGDLFRWHRMWRDIGNWFGLEPAEFPGHPTPLEKQMQNAPVLWASIAKQYKLAEPDVAKLVSWWHSDADLGREIECFNDMRNSRNAGFLSCQDSRHSFFDVFDRLVAENIIPYPKIM